MDVMLHRPDRQCAFVCGCDGASVGMDSRPLACQAPCRWAGLVSMLCARGLNDRRTGENRAIAVSQECRVSCSRRAHLYLDTRLAVCPVCVYTMMRLACTLSAARTAEDAMDSCRAHQRSASVSGATGALLVLVLCSALQAHRSMGTGALHRRIGRGARARPVRNKVHTASPEICLCPHVALSDIAWSTSNNTSDNCMRTCRDNSGAMFCRSTLPMEPN
jgi:hypothetical protein